MTFDNLRQDLAYALRGLRLKPGFAAAVVTTLALGIGANVAMFGIVDQLLFRPPALMRDPGTAHRIYRFETSRGIERGQDVGQYARYRDLATSTTSFSSFAAHARRDMAVGLGEASREMSIGAVSAAFFEFFDAPPLLGRYFTAAEDQTPSGSPVAVLSYSMWRTQYGGKRDVLGATIHIGPVAYTVIGVAPRGFVGLWPDKPPAAFVPVTSYAAGNAVQAIRMGIWWETYSWGWASMIARRRSGVPVETANAELTNALLRSYDAQRNEQPGTPPNQVLRPRAIAGSILVERGPNESSTAKVATWVAGVSFIVLLVACANVANLLLTRALHRRREIALRLALGVTRGRLVTQLLVESLVLSLLGGGAGILLAHWGGAALRSRLLDQADAVGGLRDPRTMLFAAAAALVVGLLCGLAPVLQASRADLTADLKSGAREGTYGRSRTRVGLLLLQGALSVVLLVGAGLFVRSLHNVQAVRLGYDMDRVLLVSPSMRGVTLDSGRTVALRRRLQEAALSLPAVENASLQASVPFWSTTTFGLYVAGIDTVSRLGRFTLNIVSPEHFSTMGTRILRGRGIEATDQLGAPRAMVVSEAMARVLWKGEDPLGQCARVIADTMPCTTVVGVAENIRDQSLTGDSTYHYYLSVGQFNPRSGGIFVRTRGTASASEEEVRRRLQQEMPGASYVTVTPLTEIIGMRTRSWRLGATMFVAFGLLALGVAAVGLYSVIAYNVAQRMHELGVRVALGARAADVVRLVVGDGLRLATLGVAIGAVVALWAGRWVKDLLFNVSPRDPVIFLLVALALGLVALLASWIPAARASRVDPNIVLRSD